MEVNDFGRFGDLPPQILVSSAGVKEANGIYTLLPQSVTDGAVLYLQGGGFTIDRRHLADAPHSHGLVLAHGDKTLYTNPTVNKLDPSAVEQDWVPKTMDLLPQPVIKRASLSLATWGVIYCKVKSKTGKKWKPRWAVIEGTDLALYKTRTLHPLARYMGEGEPGAEKVIQKSMSGSEKGGISLSSLLNRRTTAKPIRVPLRYCERISKRIDAWELDGVGKMTSLDLSFAKHAPFPSISLALTSNEAATHWASSFNTVLDLCSAAVRTKANKLSKASLVEIAVAKNSSGSLTAHEKARELGMYKSKFVFNRGKPKKTKRGKKTPSNKESSGTGADEYPVNSELLGPVRELARATFSADDPFADELFAELDSESSKQEEEEEESKRTSSIELLQLSQLQHDHGRRESDVDDAIPAGMKASLNVTKAAGGSGSTNGKSNTSPVPESLAIADDSVPPEAIESFTSSNINRDVSGAIEDRNKNFFAQLKAEQDAEAEAKQRKKAELLASMTESEKEAHLEAEKQQEEHEALKGKMLKMHLKQYAKTGQGNSKILRKSKRISRNRRVGELSVLKLESK